MHADEAERLQSRRIWAALMISLDIYTCESILRGLQVQAGNLDGFVLRRALRGDRLPEAESSLQIDAALLDAVAEAGPLP